MNSEPAENAGIARGGRNGSLRDQQKAQTRLRILRAARGCFLSRGIAETGFDDVAQRAGVSRATVYLHFSRKEALLLGMLQDDWDAQAALFEACPQEGGRAEHFAAWLNRLIAAYATRRESMGLYALALGQDPGMAEMIENQRRRLLAILGTRFPAFRMDRLDPDREIAAYLMIVQIEHFCLMAARENWAHAVEAGINLLSRRLAALVAGAPAEP